MVQQQLSFVLPVSLKESGLIPGSYLSWRRDLVDAGTATRTWFLLKSFLKHFAQDDLLDFFIVCPRADMDGLSTVLASITRDARFQIVPELDVCPDIAKAVHPHTSQIDGWYAQQLLKLAISAQVRSEYYVTLDNDILCVKPFCYSTLVRGGRALTNVETPSDYEALYWAEFAAREVRTKSSRYGVAARILGYSRPSHLSARFYGETPVVVRTESVRDLASYLSDRFERPWTDALARLRRWTEYALYFQFLEMTQQLDSVCRLSGCNAVLDLPKSVWHASPRYRFPRPYDAGHFTDGVPGNGGGPFVAIQSWLSVASWLPPRCRILADFYNEVEKWCLEE
jgi:Family of unknown function (DUF6492)